MEGGWSASSGPVCWGRRAASVTGGQPPWCWRVPQFLVAPQSLSGRGGEEVHLLPGLMRGGHGWVEVVARAPWCRLGTLSTTWGLRRGRGSQRTRDPSPEVPGRGLGSCLPPSWSPAGPAPLPAASPQPTRGLEGLRGRLGAPICSVPGKPEAGVPLSWFPAPGPSRGDGPQSLGLAGRCTGMAVRQAEPYPSSLRPGFSVEVVYGGGGGSRVASHQESRSARGPHSNALFTGTQQGAPTMPAA